eukprot:SAG25_NODE_8469_length_420_cov_0.947040_1_plen_59_part_00
MFWVQGYTCGGGPHVGGCRGVAERFARSLGVMLMKVEPSAAAIAEGRLFTCDDGDAHT